MNRGLSLEYVAGFFDGEGCVNLNTAGKNRRVVLRVMIVNTEPSILSLLQAQFGGHLSTRARVRQGWKPFNCLTLTGHGGAAFLSDIAPYVRVKAAQVALGLEFWTYKQRPKSERCTYRRQGQGTVGQLRPAVIAAEQRFKGQMHLLNRKGA